MQLTILDRYFLRDILRAWLAVLLVLMLIMLSNKLTRFLQHAASGEWSIDVVLPMLGLAAVGGLALVVPMAIFLAVILVVGRLYKDSEMAVISGCGISTLQLYRPLGLMAVALTLFMSVLSFYVIPSSKRGMAYLQAQAERTSIIAGVSSGRFLQSEDGRRVVYVEADNAQQQLATNVFARHLTADGQQRLITARSAYRHIDKTTGDTLVKLHDGYRYSGAPGHTDFRVIQYKTHWLHADGDNASQTRLRYESKPTSALLRSDHPYARAELHWRLAMAFSAALFALLGLPLGRLKQREGRYGRIMVGALIYIIYFKTLQVGQMMLERQTLPQWAGLWWAHLALLVYLGWKLSMENRVGGGE